jgi:hypothetical protein
MPVLSFPFWIVMQRRGLISKPVEPVGMPGYIAAFTSAPNAAAFMVERGETEWENKLISRSTLSGLLADLRQIGMQGVCIDPTGDGPGAKITFEEIEKAL